MDELYAVPRIRRRDRPDGTVLLESAVPLEPPARSVAEWLRHWAAVDPDAVLVAERGPAWRRRTYGEVCAAANAIGQALLDRGLSAERPLMILSGNSIGHLGVAGIRQKRGAGSGSCRSVGALAGKETFAGAGPDCGVAVEHGKQVERGAGVVDGEAGAVVKASRLSMFEVGCTDI